MTFRFAGATLGSIVAADYRTAAVLDRVGLDFCCGGKRTLEEACAQAQLEVGPVDASLAEVADDATIEMPDATWPADQLVRFIVERHHAFVRTQLPVIGAHLDRLVRAHGRRHPELGTVAAHFAQVSGELQRHLRKEEEILFPYICALMAAAGQHAAPPPNMFGTVMNPIRMMEAEHQTAGNELELVRELTSNFSVPDDGCATYRVCFEELAAFDRDLRLHIHLENNILFPKAAALETAVAGGRRGGG